MFMKCLACGKIHDVEERVTYTTELIDNTYVRYPKNSMYCYNTNKNYTTINNMLENRNMLYKMKKD